MAMPSSSRFFDKAVASASAKATSPYGSFGNSFVFIFVPLSCGPALLRPTLINGSEKKNWIALEAFSGQEQGFSVRKPTRYELKISFAERGFLSKTEAQKLTSEAHGTDLGLS